jgi:hypothetical protein
MTIARAQTERFGANPFNIEGPIVSGSGIPAPNFALGSLAWGDMEAEWVYCKLVLGSTTTIQPGQWVQWDKDYTATLLTTANGVIGRGVGVLNIQSVNSTTTGTASAISLAAGTYYMWVQRAGQAPCLVSASTTANLVIVETTTTAGQANVPASATVSTKGITPVSFEAASTTFTATTVSGSPVLTAIGGNANVASGPFIGATLSGTGVSAVTVASITYGPNGTISSITMSGNASASGTGVTITATGVLEGRLAWPYIYKTN